MKTQVVAALAALMTVAAFSGSASAQSSDGANVEKYGIAVIDITYIFKNHAKFKAAREAMQADFQQVEASVKGQQQKLAQLQEQKKQYQPGAPELNEIDEQLIKMQANLQVEVSKKRKQLVEQEAKIYYETYLEVDDMIKKYAKHRGIGLVLRFNGEEADPNNRESIIRSINRAVHFQNQIDITPDVLTYLNRAAAESTATRPAAAAAPARR